MGDPFRSLAKIWLSRRPSSNSEPGCQEIVYTITYDFCISFSEKSMPFLCHIRNGREPAALRLFLGRKGSFWKGSFWFLVFSF